MATATEDIQPATRRHHRTDSRSWDKGFLLKLLLMGLVDALGVFGLFAAGTVRSWTIVVVLAVLLVAANVVYFSRRMIPAKYLVPGLIFLLIYQIFVILYTGYAAFTNYGDGHNSTKEDAIAAITANTLVRIPDSPAYPTVILSKNDSLYLLVTEPASGTPLIGGADDPLHDAPEAQLTDGEPTGVPGYNTLTFSDILGLQQQVTALRVPLSADPNDGVLRTPDGSSAFVYRPTLVYDESVDALRNTVDGTVYSDSGTGNFRSRDGDIIEPGWLATVGFTNFTTVLTDRSLRGPFLGVLLWTFAYATLSVVLTFVIGLALALVLNHPNLRGRRIYRSLLILPYAFPAFLAALVWQGMLNPQFGYINQSLLGGASINWLGDPWLARFAVVFVNVWMGFPYMFLVCTGAIQALPADAEEAAKVDGAGWFQLFARIKLPLLLVATAPLLISSFALNFNNFNSIYLLTGGGPLAAPTDRAGATDILISFVYRLAFGGVNRQYGLACAISIIIFLIIGTVSALAFKRTRSLEELS